MCKWKLYWVSSNGRSDCFIVAKNSSSAKSFEKDVNDYTDEELTATRVKDIPDKYEKIADKKFKELCIKHNCHNHPDINDLTAWPGYAEDWLLKKLGAEIRYIDEEKEILIDDIVYGPNRIYPIGIKAMRSLNELDESYIKENYEVNYEGIDKVIEDMLGKSIIKIHKIEDYITNSFIFGIGNKKYANYPIPELIKYWKDNLTFGKLIKLMEEQYDINEDVYNSLQLFLTQRNKIAHGLTKEERYDIETLWGQKELVGYLAIFWKNATLLEKAMKSAFIATIDFVYYILERDPTKCTKKLKKEIEEFRNDPHIQEALTLFLATFHEKNKPY